MKSSHKALSVCSYKKKIYALFETADEGRRELYITESQDGVNFLPISSKSILIGSTVRREKLENLHDFKLSKDKNGFYLSYVKIPRSKSEVVIAFSKDGIKFSPEEAGTLHYSALIIDDFVYNKSPIVLLGSSYITSALEMKGVWKETGALILSPRDGFFDHAPIRLLGVAQRENGILVSYESSSKENNDYHLKIGLALLAKDNPHHVLWRSDVPLYDKVFKQEGGDNHQPHLLGSAMIDESIYIYFSHRSGTLSSIRLPCKIYVRSKDKIHLSLLDRHENNPILEPAPENEWEREAVFNPGVIYDGEKVHMLYRAIGGDGVSRVGYASSDDGVVINNRLNYPVYEPTRDFGLPKKKRGRPKKNTPPKVYNPLIYTSGGGWGGCEDPRAVEIDGRIYMTFVAFGGWDSVRMAVTSISKEDFLSNIWNWSDPVHLSPAGETHKNWILFPEKINGKFAILHGITPRILIDYVDDIENLPEPIKSIRPAGPQPGREGYWDHRVRGAGPPPVKTSLGWLVLYHATGKFDGHRYKLGAMLLDLNDPTKILYRSSNFILAPDMPYENEGKPGIVYASGAVIIKENLYVYYGGGDRVVCVATIPVETLLEKLKKHEEVKLEPTEAVLV